MRSLDEINIEYGSVCSKLGDLYVKQSRLLAQIEKALEPLIKRSEELETEAMQVKLVAEAKQAKQ